MQESGCGGHSHFDFDKDRSSLMSTYTDFSTFVVND